MVEGVVSCSDREMIAAASRGTGNALPKLRCEKSTRSDVALKTRLGFILRCKLLCFLDLKILLRACRRR